jgi:hypothetical protein
MNDQELHMPSQRRGFLKASGAFTLMVGLNGLGSIFPSSGLMRHGSLAELHFADFDTLVGQSFRVYVANSLPRVVQLAAVKSRAHVAFRAAGPRHECFSLAFTGPKGEPLPQGTHTFAHPRLGHFDLFVVPTMAVDYEERAIAIINRI